MADGGAQQTREAHPRAFQHRDALNRGVAYRVRDAALMRPQPNRPRRSRKPLRQADLRQAKGMGGEAVAASAAAERGRLAKEQADALALKNARQVFVNTMLAEPWRGDAGSDIDESELARRAEPFGLAAIPEEVLVLTAGADVQVDRIEVTVTGWARDGTCFVLGHEVLWGPPDEEQVWRDLDDLLKTRWPHPLGGSIGLDAAVIDSGFATESVYRFAFARSGRRIMAGKGMTGARPIIAASKSRIATKTGLHGRLWIVGVDGIKSTLFSKLARGRSIRFSESLEPSYFEHWHRSGLSRATRGASRCGCSSASRGSVRRRWTHSLIRPARAPRFRRSTSTPASTR
jgi:hypothetical protein